MPPILLTMLCLGISGAWAGTVFKWVDAQGVVHYSDYPPPDTVPVREVLDIEDSNAPDWDASQYLKEFLENASQERERRAKAREKRLAERRAAEAAQPRTIVYREPEYDPYYGYVRYDTYPRYPYHRPYYWKKHRGKHRGHYGGHGKHPRPTHTLTSSTRSFRLPGGHRRFGHLGHRLTHRKR